MDMIIIIVLVLGLIAFALMPRKEEVIQQDISDADSDQEFDREEYEAQRLREERVAQEELEIQQERNARIEREELTHREGEIAQSERTLRFAQDEIDERAARLDLVEIDTNNFQQQLENQKADLDQREQETRSTQQELEAKAEEISRRENEVNAAQEKFEQERLEQERLEQERLEQERLEQERLEQEKLEQERLEQERLEQEKVGQETDSNQDQPKAKIIEQDASEVTESPISEQQIKLVKSTWKMIFPVKDQIAELFYRKLFQMDPEVKPLFKNDIKAQGDKLVTSINLVVNSLDNLEHVVPALQDMGRRHIDYGVKAEHYDTVGGALLWTLEQGLSDDFTPDVKAAWTTAYGIIASTMIDAAY